MLDFLNRKKNRASLISLMYIIHVVYFFSLFFRSSQSATFEYITVLVIISLVWVFVANSFLKKGRVKNHQLQLLMLIAFFVLTAPIVKTNYYAITLYVEIISFALFFKNHHIPKSEFIKCISNIYTIYFLISFLVWIGIIPNFFYDSSIHKVSEYQVSIGSINYYIMPGLSGSPAGIDIFSSCVILLNLLFATKQSKYYIFIAVVGLFLTFRLTPFLSLSIVAMTYFFVRNKYTATLLLFLSSGIFLLFLYGLYTNYSFTFNGERIYLDVIGYIFTHARSMIWEQQLHILLSEYDLFDYFFGRFSISLFGVQHFQFSGLARGDEFQGNPHNTHLLLFLREPFLYIIFFFIFIYTNYKNYSRRNFAIIFLLFLACFSNSAIISLGNPVYIIILIYLLIHKTSRPNL